VDTERRGATANGDGDGPERADALLLLVVAPVVLF
jgi:hypothetical protein